MSSDLLLLCAAGALGAILGSFVNALSFRYNTGTSVLRGRSRCMHCGHELGALDLVPILSYVFLRGRCRYCGARYSAQYPLVEAASVLLGVLVYINHPEPLMFALWLCIVLVLLFIVVYDARHFIIPWGASLTLLALAAVHLLFATDLSPLALLAGPLLAVPLLLISVLSRGRAMGWADSVLELSLGSFLGLTAGLTALMLAFWAGALVGIALMLAGNRYTMKSEVPFAPFLVLGALVAHFLHVDLFPTLPLLF